MKRFVALIALFASGCAYNVQSSIVAAPTAYTTSGSKVPGLWGVVVDVPEGSVIVRPKSYVCSAHNFPFDITSTFENSVVESLRANFSDVIQIYNSPSLTLQDGRRLSGIVRVRLGSFEPSIRFDQGFWSTSGDAEVYISAGVVFERSGRAPSSFSISQQRSADGGAFSCGEGATLLGDAASKAMRDLMRDLTERLMTSSAVQN